MCDEQFPGPQAGRIATAFAMCFKYSFNSRLEAIVITLEAIASRLEAIAIGLEAVPIGLKRLR